MPAKTQPGNYREVFDFCSYGACQGFYFGAVAAQDGNLLWAGVTFTPEVLKFPSTIKTFENPCGCEGTS
jgi:hypothetical protein